MSSRWIAIRDLLPRFARVASLVCGIAVFGPGLTSLLYFGPRAPRDAWVVLLTTCVVWALAFAPPLERVRAWIQVIASLCILAAPLVLPTGPAWVVPSTVGFGIMVAVVFNYRPLLAIPLVVVTSTLVAVVTITKTPAAGFVLDVPLDGYLGAVMVLMSGLGLTLSLAQWGRLVDIMDSDRASLRTREAERRRSMEVSRHRRLIERRIHETVLNTMSAIAYGVAAENRASAVAACRRDIDTIDADNQTPGDAPASVVARLAAEVFSGSGPRIDIQIDSDPLVPMIRAEALRDALVESLRNVERHSGAASVLLGVTGDDPVVVTVIDQGSGFDLVTTPRFGLDTSVRAGIESVGGTVEIASSPGRGTSVSITVPTSMPAEAPEPDFPARRVMSWSFLGRLGLIGMSGTIIIGGWTLAEPWPDPMTMRIALATMVALTVAVAAAWNTRWRLPLALIGIISTLTCFALCLPVAQTCATSGDLAWTIALLGGAALLFHLAASAWWLRLLTLAAVSAAGFLVATLTPDACRAEPTLTAATNLLFVGAIVLGFIWIDVFFERRRRADVDLWHKLSREQAEVAGRAVFSAGWSIVDEPSRDLLRRIAFGRLDPASEAAQITARSCAAAIRSRLGRSDSSASPTETLLADLESIARDNGSALEIHVLDAHQRSDAYPDAISFTCRQIVRRAPGALLRVVTLVDGDDEEIAIHVSPWPSRLREGLIPQGWWDDCRIDLDVDPLEPEEARLSVRRALRPMTLTGDQAFLSGDGIEVRLGSRSRTGG